MFAAILPYVYNLRSDFIRAAFLRSNCIYDVVGITALTIASNVYHSRKHAILCKHDEVLITNNVMVNGLKEDEKDASTEFFFDAGAIHLKSFLSLIAMGSDRGNQSAIIHGIFFFGSQLYSVQQIQIASSENKHMKVFNACVIIPALYDLIHIIYLTHGRETQLPIAITIATIGIVLKLLNHLVVHFLVILQTWYIASAIMNVSPSIE